MGRIKLTDSETVPIMLEAGFEPLEPYASAPSPWKCIHNACGEIVHPRFNHVKRGEVGCRFCFEIKNSSSKSGFSDWPEIFDQKIKKF